MAILESVPGVTAEVRVNNIAVKEYVDTTTEDPPNTVIKYIEAISGQNFTVNWQFQPNFVHRNHSIYAIIYIDGKNVCSQTTIVEKFRGNCCRHEEVGDIRSYQGEQRVMQKFAFSAITIDDDSERVICDSLKHKVDTLGEIKIKLLRVKHLGYHVSSNRRGHRIASIDKIPEKALKGNATSHQLGLDQPIPIPSGSGRRTDFDYIDQKSSPFAIFSFKYRSVEALKALHIIPRTPPPRQKDSTEYLIKKEAESENARKRTRDNSQASNSVEGRPTKRAKADVIDLTGDD
ncbi:uncharacterized protein K452DRAFT_318156 [Aplosporella prunicola CBS 121167]|uniref:DUF7918 domain-containing protein n=1 Tax=Aplosporella prunicola CBS 121167 TaxID=1176127 RepID=A0A6A6BGW0_9PEZI|nr:uncharacterized protein K452DRAFT_318156 [Aplosporella prunicola CBS 121167]KAF2142555.1 hypothetical protein K452DRAFT_318156 [Aplosporella prunicola CBS 121167]